MKSRVIPFLLSSVVLVLVVPSSTEAQHKLGEGNAFVPGTVLPLEQSPYATIGGEIVIKKSPLLRIHSTNGQVLHRSDGMIQLKGWSFNPMWAGDDGQDPRRYRVTFITESNRSPDSRWQTSMHFKPLDPHTSDLVVKLPNRVVAQYQQMCKEHGKRKEYQSEKGGSVKGHSSTSIEPYVKYEVEHSNGVDRGTLSYEEPSRRNGSKSYSSELRVAIYYECILPGTGPAIISGTRVSPDVVKTTPPKPTVKRPTVNKPSPVKAR